MTTRALFWCGYAGLAAGRLEGPRGDDDALISTNDLEFAIEAARRLGVEDRSMHAFVYSEELSPPGYVGVRCRPTPSELDRTIEQLTRTATADDTTLFFATNHGIEEGLLTSVRVDEFEPDKPSLLTPNALAQSLDKLPGAQVVVIATCYAGSFLRIAEPNRRLVLTACGNEAYYAGGRTAWSAFPAELFRAWCGVIPEGGTSPDRMDLDTAFKFAEQRVMSGEVGRTVQPRRAGSVRWPP